MTTEKVYTLEDVKNITGIRVHTELARKFGVKPQAVTNWKKEGVPQRVQKILMGMEVDANQNADIDAMLETVAEAWPHLCKQQKKDILKIVLLKEEEDRHLKLVPSL